MLDIPLCDGGDDGWGWGGGGCVTPLPKQFVINSGSNSFRSYHIAQGLVNAP